MICIFINVNPCLDQISDTYPMCAIAGIIHPGTGFPRATKGAMARTFNTFTPLIILPVNFRDLWEPAFNTFRSSGQG